MKRTSLVALVASLVVMSPEAIAERGGKGNDSARGNSANAQTSARNRGNSNRNGGGELNQANGNSANARANPSTGFCPPGLRKGADGCVPAGQAANGVTAAEWAEQRGYRYVPGAELTEDEFTPLPNYADYDLPELSGTETYVVIERTAVVIDSETNTFLRIATR